MLVVFFWFVDFITAHHLFFFTFEALYELFKYKILVQVLNVIPIKGGAPPKFAQRTQLITDNYQVVWQVFICHWIMSIKNESAVFLHFLYLILSKSEICDAGLVIFTDMNLILLNLGCLCGFFLVPTFSVVVYVRLILHSNSVKSRFCESIFCYRVLQT